MARPSHPFAAHKRTALVIGASGGLGGAIADRLDNGPGYDEVQPASRRGGDLDITDPASVVAFANIHQDRRFDLIINATGALTFNGAAPEKSFAEIDADAMAAAFRTNAVGPAILQKHLAPLLRTDRRAVFVHFSARVGSIGDNRLGGWVSYRASKAALNQIIRCAAIELQRKNPSAIVIGFHPGTIETEMTRRFAKGRYTASAGECADHLIALTDRLTPDDSGHVFDYAGERLPW